MAKLYYDDPLAAAYMAREFGVEFEGDNYQSLTESCYMANSKPKEMPFIVRPNSLHVFEPMEGDLFFNCSKEKKRKIIQRNNKPFFWPKSES